MAGLCAATHKEIAPGLFHAWDEQGSSLLNVLMPGGFPIAPQWISPILTAGLTATECLSASESAESAPVRLHSCNVVSTPGIRWVRWGGRGDEMRLRGVVIRSPGSRDRPDSRDRWRTTYIGHPSPVTSRWTFAGRGNPLLFNGFDL